MNKEKKEIDVNDYGFDLLENEEEILLIKDYKPVEEDEKIIIKISKSSLEALKESGIEIINE